MPDLFDVKQVDREFYESRLREFLPPRIIDVHTHVWTENRSLADSAAIGRVVTWPARVAATSPIEHLLETYRLLLPGKRVTPLIFSSPTAADVDPLNAYVADCAHRCNLPALLLSRPEWSAAELEDKVVAGGFIGIKPYLSYAPSHLAENEITVFDFLPPHQLEMLDRRAQIVMLHLPRPARLRDPMNLAQMLEIEQRFPRLHVIIAHVGRAYCPEDVGNAFEALAPTKRVCFDISANTNAYVFTKLLEAVGPRRVMFGSDMPILRMRMRRICEHGRYINIVPKGLYGDVSGDSHMRETDGPDADRLTFFLYEELDAFRHAAHGANLAPQDIEDVFYGNAARMIEEARQAT